MMPMIINCIMHVYKDDSVSHHCRPKAHLILITSFTHPYAKYKGYECTCMSAGWHCCMVHVMVGSMYALCTQHTHTHTHTHTRCMSIIPTTQLCACYILMCIVPTHTTCAPTFTTPLFTSIGNMQDWIYS